MAGLMSAIKHRLFGYDAVEDRGRRKPARSVNSSEDAVLPSCKRTKLVATTRDILRNYALAAWMIRCHLDYVIRFTFQARNSDETLNLQLEALIETASLPENFDVAGRVSRAKGLRISEARRILDGDVFWAKLSSGRVQLIEGDRVRTPGDAEFPTGTTAADFTEGIQTSPGGRLRNVIVCKRGPDGRGYVFERVIPARNIWQHACWDTTYRVDQVRGISPLAPALNTLQDIYEGIDLALAKAKIAQMFGLVFYRQALEEKEGWAPGRATDMDTDPDAEGGEAVPTEDPDADTERYEVDPGAGPFKLELKDTDRAEFLSTNTPETELLNFLIFTTDLSLKCLDIPYSFYDSSKANYYAQKADIQKYENSARSKREDNQQLLDNWAYWQVQLAILDGSFALPAGMSIDDLRWEWVPAGMPWIDKLRDMKADALAIDRNLDSEVRAARRSGQDAKELARERMEYEGWIIQERLRRNLPPLAPTAAAIVSPNDDGKVDDNA